MRYKTSHSHEMLPQNKRCFRSFIRSTSISFAVVAPYPETHPVLSTTIDSTIAGIISATKPLKVVLGLANVRENNQRTILQG